MILTMSAEQRRTEWSVSDGGWHKETSAVCDVQVIQDFENCLQYAEAERILDVRDADDCGREYLVAWADGAADSWESEDSISSTLVVAFEKERKSGAADTGPANQEGAAAPKEPAAAGAGR